MDVSISSWNECISIKKIMDLDFEQQLGIIDCNGKDIAGGVIIDSILSNLPILSFIIFKHRNKLYTNQYRLIQYIKYFLNNKIKIEESGYYLNNITGKSYGDFSTHEQECISNCLVNCTILDLNNCEEEILTRIFFRYYI